MGLVSWYGAMDAATLDTGRTIRSMVMAYTGLKTVVSSSARGTGTSSTFLVHIRTDTKSESTLHGTWDGLSSTWTPKESQNSGVEQ